MYMNVIITLSPWRKRSPHIFNAPLSKIVPFSPWDEGLKSWIEDAHEQKDQEIDLEPTERKDADRLPKIGDLVIIPLDTPIEPFTVAKILSVKNGHYTVQWYGNKYKNMNLAFIYYNVYI